MRREKKQAPTGSFWARIRSASTWKAVAHAIGRHPAEVFCVLALVFGIAICFRMPPLSGTDEFTHFPRAYQIQSGKLWSSKLSGNSYGGDLPTTFVDMINDYRDLSRKTTEDLTSQAPRLTHQYNHDRTISSTKTQASFSTSAVYSPWSFLPSLLGIKLAKMINVPPLWYVYLGRLSTLLVWVILGWLAIRTLPFGKWFLFAVAMLPASLVQAATISPDSFVNGVSWLIIAITLAVLAKKVKTSHLTLGLLLGLSLLATTIKQGYWILALWPLIIPIKYFSGKSTALIWKAAAIVTIVSASLLYVSYTSPIIKNIPARQDIPTSYSAQLDYTINNPLKVSFNVLSEPLTKTTDIVLYELVGVFTNRTIYLSLFTILLLYQGLTLSLLQIPIQQVLRPLKLRLLFSVLAVLAAFYIFISLVMYLTFSPVGNDLVYGLHGRYFIPLLPLLIAIAALYKKAYLRLSDTAVAGILISITLFALVNTVFALGK